MGYLLAGAAAGALAGLAPDADILIGSTTDPLLAIEHHRGFTHALIFVPAGAALVAALWLLGTEWRERGRWLALWAAAGISYLSHVLLDAATSYGTRLFWPFSDERAGWDWIAIVDPAFTVPLLVGLGWLWIDGLKARDVAMAAARSPMMSWAPLTGTSRTGAQSAFTPSAQRSLAMRRA